MALVIKHFRYALMIMILAPLAHATEAHLGFYRPSDPRLPGPVRAATHSVYLIVAPAGEMITVADFLDVMGVKTIDDAIKQILTTPLTGNLTQGDRDAAIYQLRGCTKARNPRQCEMYRMAKQSSGYLVGDGRHLKTAYHAVRDVLRGKLHYHDVNGEMQGSGEVLLFVYDSHGKQVWSPSSGAATATLPYRRVLAANPGGFTPSNDDIVEITLDKSLGKGLTVSDHRLRPGQKCFLIGYPMATSDRAAFNAPDSPGKHLRVSAGQILTPVEAASNLNLGPGDLNEKDQALLDSLVISNADGAPGLSGGASVDEQGRVFGTYTAGSPIDGSASMKVLSYSSDESINSKSDSEAAPLPH